MKRSWARGLSRLTLVAWVGAAVFFVAVAIRPIRSPYLETTSKALLANMLFPGYYAFGFALLICGWLATLLSWRRLTWQLAWITLALIIMSVDWFTVYTPLAEMTRRQWMEQAAPDANFRQYHIASMALNTASLACACLAALLSCWSEETAPVAPVSASTR